MKIPTALRAAALLPLLLAVAACGGSPDAGSPPGQGATPPPAQGAPPPPPAAAAAPAITALDVHGAPPAGGTTVVIEGTAFQAGLGVTFGGVPATSVSLDASVGAIACLTPALPAGLYDVVVTNPDGQSATFAGFHYGPPPAPTTFFPGSGSPGASLTVIGGDLIPGMAGGSQVSIGGVTARITSSTLLGRFAGAPVEFVVVLPDVPPGTYQVIVTNPDGQQGVAPGTFVVP
jgi:IPT/TIG domain-containing protein